MAEGIVQPRTFSEVAVSRQNVCFMLTGGCIIASLLIAYSFLIDRRTNPARELGLDVQVVDSVEHMDTAVIESYEVKPIAQIQAIRKQETKVIAEVIQPPAERPGDVIRVIHRNPLYRMEEMNRSVSPSTLKKHVDTSSNETELPIVQQSFVEITNNNSSYNNSNHNSTTR